MKKIILFVILMFMTACSNETMQGYLTVECVKEDSYNNVKNVNTVTIKHKDNDIVNIKYSYKYETEQSYILDSYKQSLISESNKYTSENISINNNEENNYFEMIYDIDVSVINDIVKQDFEIQDLASNQIKLLEQKGYSCK